MNKTNRRAIWVLIVISTGLILLASCSGSKEEIETESWINKPLKKWPHIALTNNIVFDDTTYIDIANGFLVDTGTDTLAVTVKHFFSLFSTMGLMTVDFQGKLESWKMYPRNSRDDIVVLGDLINRNPSEVAAIPNTTNNEDWLVFKVESASSNIHPLTIGDGSVRAGEYLYNLGWTMNDKDNPPNLYKFKVYRIVGNQIFMEPIEFPDNPGGISGSPLFNRQGQLVGISSGGEGGLARACSVYYLLEVLEKHKARLQ